MDEWREYQLKDVCSRLSSGKNIKSREVLDKGKYPVYGGNGLRGYSDKANFSGECAIIGRQGAYCGNVRYFSGTAYMTEHAIVTVANENNSTRFLAYLLSMMHLGRLSGQSAQPGLSVKTLGQQIVKLPSYKLQNQIASVLTILDDKIEINNQINKNLLEQAQAIYTKRFITDADSLWPEGKLSDLIEVCYGKDHKKLHDGDIPVYGSGGIMRHVDRALYEQESVLVPRKGTLNNVMYVDEPFWSVDTMFFTKMKRQNVAKFVFHFLKGKDLASMNAGSAVPSMTTKILNAIPLQIPDDQTLSTFEAQVSPFYQAASYNNKESENLAAIRDSLLPKLMSGEIDVSDIDI